MIVLLPKYGDADYAKEAIRHLGRDLVLHRRGSGSYNQSTMKYEAGDLEVIEIYGVIQPIRSNHDTVVTKNVDNDLGQGERISGSHVLHTEFQIHTCDENGVGDLILWNSKKWEVVQISYEEEGARFYRAELKEYEDKDGELSATDV